MTMLLVMTTCASQAARCLVQALGSARAVRISEQLVVDPGQVLLRCVGATVRYLITVLAFDGKVRLPLRRFGAVRDHASDLGSVGLTGVALADKETSVQL
jgi:hypothetical protein